MSDSMTGGFATPLSLCGPLREPKQMLAEQEYGGHLSIHDDDTAEKLGFKAGPIEGPTHFSQFDPLLAAIWGDRWFRRAAYLPTISTCVLRATRFGRLSSGGVRIPTW